MSVYRIGDTVPVRVAPFLIIPVTLLAQADADEVNRVGVARWADARTTPSPSVAILH